MAASAGLRNRLVHECDDLAAARVHAAAGTALHDVPDRVRAVQEYLARLDRA